ncbi:2 beta-glucanase [Dichomitus squalens LYAD-421 SS1]|uniref:2 beta-glucanase n=1 Tax=Dichomitus squalens (strain LYAD-421) TaxID=732165 RepID=R7SJQ9_DICSQ|nr:2 beta-glucanase [Dichomitus squalens LYAD-421 SS1]EJF56379.1 2 beta-glucanase [Dichomitus squalens LYAD-421 SS1]
MYALLSLLILASLGVNAFGATYSQSDSHTGTGFLKSFTHEAISDPTHGRVNYVDQSTALAKNLTFASGDTFIIRADHTTTLSSSGPGRDSVRLQSNKQYTTHVTIWNIRHMPQGCGTWPAVWEVGADWPNNGEVDILEGVNDQSPNQATLHTSSGCSMPSSRDQSGNSVGNNCDTASTNNAGCGVQVTQSNSYGPSFNSNGGGWYAMERTDTEVKVWFWPRNGNVPSDVANGETTIDTDGWGQPFAYFPDTDCDINSHFGPQNLIINLTFCGDWAGAVFDSDNCPGDCATYVNENPAAFTNAYFDIAWLKIYE